MKEIAEEAVAAGGAAAAVAAPVVVAVLVVEDAVKTRQHSASFVQQARLPRFGPLDSR